MGGKKMAKLFIILTCFFAGCKNSSSQLYYFNTVVDSLRRDTFYVDAPKTLRGNIGPEFLSGRRLEKFYNLEVIDKGYDSVNIRIWLGYSRHSTGLINIVNSRTSWEATMIVYSARKKDIHDTTFIYEKSSEIKQPRDSWDGFMGKLASLNFLTLPSDDIIPEYDQTTGDSKRVLVEISTKYFYKIYSYTEPYAHHTYIKEAAQLEQILDYIKDQFQFQFQEKI